MGSGLSLNDDHAFPFSDHVFPMSDDKIISKLMSQGMVVHRRHTTFFEVTYPPDWQFLKLPSVNCVSVIYICKNLKPFLTIFKPKDQSVRVVFGQMVKFNDVFVCSGRKIVIRDDHINTQLVLDGIMFAKYLCDFNRGKNDGSWLDTDPLAKHRDKKYINFSDLEPFYTYIHIPCSSDFGTVERWIEKTHTELLDEYDNAKHKLLTSTIIIYFKWFRQGKKIWDKELPKKLYGELYTYTDEGNPLVGVDERTLFGL